MEGVSLTFRAVDTFFDRRPVVRAVDRAERRVLSKIGAFVRRRARSSIRRRKKVSEAGKPPSAHAAGGSGPEAGLKFILFAYSPRTRSVVIGPVLLNGGKAGSQTVPELLEFGGRAVVHEERWKGQPTWRRRNLRHRLHPRKEYRRRSAVYKARPFMRKALDEEKKRFAGLFRNEVKDEGGGADGVVSLLSAAL